MFSKVSQILRTATMKCKVTSYYYFLKSILLASICCKATYIFPYCAGIGYHIRPCAQQSRLTLMATVGGGDLLVITSTFGAGLLGFAELQQLFYESKDSKSLIVFIMIFD